MEEVVLGLTATREEEERQIIIFTIESSLFCKEVEEEVVKEVVVITVDFFLSCSSLLGGKGRERGSAESKGGNEID